ncbi:MAG: dihydroorotase [bacterium]|jgi:dihydroorotase
MKKLVKNARVINPATQFDQKADVLIENGRIVDISKSITDKEAQLIPADGLWLLPGLVDIHVHLREPGQESKETIATGTRSAAAGGVTSLLCMPNTIPPVDNRTGIEFILERSERVGYVRVYPSGAITKGMEGKEISHIGDMVEAGAVALAEEQEDLDSLVMLRAMQYASMFGIPMIAHCEDRSLTEAGAVNEGRMSMMMGVMGIPSEAEAIMVARDALLCMKTQSRLHLAHVSCAESVDLIRFYKKKGAPLTAEVTPHHLVLTEEATDFYNTMAKVNPPLRTRTDQDALYEGLRDGTIDCIASSHSPHTPADKNREFPEAEYGVVGLETMLPLIMGEIQERLGVELHQLLKLVTYNPAQVMNLHAGDISPGSLADYILWNPDTKYKVDKNQFYSKAENTPFHGWELQGQVEQTWIAGECVFNRDKKEFHRIHGRVI